MWRLRTDFGYVVRWGQTDDGAWYVAGFLDPFVAVQDLEDGGYTWVADDTLKFPRAVQSHLIEVASMENYDAMPPVSR